MACFDSLQSKLTLLIKSQEKFQHSRPAIVMNSLDLNRKWYIHLDDNQTKNIKKIIKENIHHH